MNSNWIPGSRLAAVTNAENVGVALEPRAAGRLVGAEEHDRKDLNSLEQTVSRSLYRQDTTGEEFKGSKGTGIGKWNKRACIVTFFSAWCDNIKLPCAPVISFTDT